jgi:hypothetical protein
MVSYFINKSKEPKKDSAVTAKTNETRNAAPEGGRRRRGGSAGIKGDTVFVKIYTAENELIRTMQWPADSGFNRQYWGFETKGKRQPGSAKPKAGDEEPRGLQVYPGKFKFIFTYKNESDSTYVTVNPDPAVQPNKTIYDAKKAAFDRLSKSSDQLVLVTDRLTEAEEVISKLEGNLKNIETPAADSLRKSCKAMTDSIKNIRYFLSGKPQEKQGYGSPYQLTVMSKLYEARNEIGAKNKVPDQQEFAMIEIAEKLTGEAVQRTNLFFDGAWKAFKNLATSTQPPLFNEYAPIN